MRPITRHFAWAVLMGGMLLAVCSHLAAQQKMQGVVIYLRDGGFTPSQITLPRGKFLLVVKNRSTAQQIAIGVVRQDNVVAVAPVASTGRSQDFMLDLPTGVHKLFDSNHGAWSKLTITIH